MTAPASRCACCGNNSVRPRTGAGRFRPYRMMPALALPGDLPIPTCGRCHAQYIDGATADALSQALHAAFEAELRRRAREAVAQVCKHISQRRLEKLIGLSQGYLSRLHAEQGTPSAALVALLALLAQDPPARLREVEVRWVTAYPLRAASNSEGAASRR
jgi:hypothetical protein